MLFPLVIGCRPILGFVRQMWITMTTQTAIIGHVGSGINTCSSMMYSVVRVRSKGGQVVRQRPQCDGIEATSTSIPPLCASLLQPPTSSSAAASVVVNLGGPSCVSTSRPTSLNCDARPSSRHCLPPANDWRTIKRVPYYYQLQRLKQAGASSDKTTTV